MKWWFDPVEAELPIPECIFGLTHRTKKRAKIIRRRHSCFLDAQASAQQLARIWDGAPSRHRTGWLRRMRAPQHCASHHENRMPDADCETEVFTTDSALSGGSHRVVVNKPILVSSTGPCKAFQAASCLPVGGQQVEIWNSAKADHGARLVNTVLFIPQTALKHRIRNPPNSFP